MKAERWVDGTPKTRTNYCSRCGYCMDAATCLEDEQALPEEGSYSICLKCCHVTVYRADLSLREITEEEWRKVPQEILLLIARIRRAHREVIPPFQQFGEEIKRTI